MMTGPLSTTIPPPVVEPGARLRPPVPYWWGNDEDASHGNVAAMAQMTRR